MPDSSEKPFSTPEEQSAWLRGRFREKTGEYAVKGEIKEEAEIAKEVLREASEIPEAEALETYKLDYEKIQTHSHALADEPHHKQMDELVSFAQSNGLLSAVHLARKLGPHLLDDFHDRLIADGHFPMK